MSINRYDLTRMILMAAFVFVSYNIADFSLREAVWRIKLILPLVMVVGIFNPIFDKNVLFTIGAIKVSAGWLSLFTLMLKGVYSVLIAYLLIVTTSIEEICYSLTQIHVPKIMVTVLLLIYRYVMILGEEAYRITTAYQLRAPMQKGLHYKVWGPLVGQWLLRSFDKAEAVYESMVLRGFNGSFTSCKKYHATGLGIAYFAIWAAAFLIIRFIPLF